MTTWVGIEYLVANALIHYIERKNQRFITIEKIFNYQKSLMNYFDNEKVDAFIFGSLSTISQKYAEFFSIFTEANLIVLNDSITIDMLKDRFVLSDMKIQESFFKNADALF